MKNTVTNKPAKIQHTPEPWEVGKELNSERPGSIPVTARVRDSLRGEMHVAFVNGKAGEQEANADRIVNCVNACAGIEDPKTAIPALVDALTDLMRCFTTDPANRTRTAEEKAAIVRKMEENGRAALALVARKA